MLYKRGNIKTSACIHKIESNIEHEQNNTDWLTASTIIITIIKNLAIIY